MSYYCSFADLQNELKTHFFETGERLQFIEAIDRLYLKGRLSEALPGTDSTYFNCGDLSVSEFNNIVDKMCFQVQPSRKMIIEIPEDEMIPRPNDVFVIRHPRYTRKFLHRHDYVEMDYVAEGSCKLFFEDEELSLDEGSLCLISPGSYHDYVIDDESTVYSIMLRRSTFRSSFFSILSKDNVLSNFFRSSLVDTTTPNYLLFHSGDRRFIKNMVQSAMFESHYPDDYSNSCCISLINMLLACVLRGSGEDPQFYQSRSGSEFAPVLNYIRHNYRTITLSSLVDEFHYSKPHMCTLIKKYTGVSFSTLIKQARISEAKDYLAKTELSVSRIAEIVGYNSADHFSRVFRSCCGMSPVEYRRQRGESTVALVPYIEQ